jgi:polyisoprenoid-binding protein YceI
MTDTKKKCWREKVTAEITLTHVQEFAQELGSNLTSAELADFLNKNGLAQSVWVHMMQAGEQYIKTSLKAKGVTMPPDIRACTQVAMVQ